MRAGILVFLTLALLMSPLEAMGSEIPVTPMDAYKASMSPTVNYSARMRIWNPLTPETEIRIAKWGELVRYSLETRQGPVHMVSLRGRRINYGQGVAALERIADLAIVPDLELVSRNYTVAWQKGPKMLGRDTVVLSVDPRTAGNVSRKVWADSLTYVPLRIEDYNYRGELIHRRIVLEISFSPHFLDDEIAEAEMALMKAEEITAKGEPDIDSLARKLGFRPLIPSFVPPGYVLVAAASMGGANRVAHLVYSDGLGAVTIQQRAVPWWARRPSRPSPGGHVMEWEGAGIRFVLVGDIDPRLLHRMASSMTR